MTVLLKSKTIVIYFRGKVECDVFVTKNSIKWKSFSWVYVLGRIMMDNCLSKIIWKVSKLSSRKKNCLVVNKGDTHLVNFANKNNLSQSSNERKLFLNMTGAVLHCSQQKKTHSFHTIFFIAKLFSLMVGGSSCKCVFKVLTIRLFYLFWGKG
jgi:hypothetical protein